MTKLLWVIGIIVLFSWGTSAYAADCVNVELGAQVVGGGPLDILQLFFSIENCGTEPASANLSVSLEKDGIPVGAGAVDVFLPAGQEFSQELELPVLPIIPTGSYTLCVTATLGTASDTACATVVLNEMGQVVGFVPDGPAPEDLEIKWGTIKSLYQ